MFDLLIKNATIIDGTGSPGFCGDIGIVRGKIVMISPRGHQGQQEEESPAPAETVIDATDRVVCPGSSICIPTPTGASSPIQQPNPPC